MKDSSSDDALGAIDDHGVARHIGGVVRAEEQGGLRLFVGTGDPVHRLAGGDALLSATSSFHRALRKAGRPSELSVFDAMPPARWYAFDMPEAREAVDIMAEFFLRHLGH